MNRFRLISILSAMLGSIAGFLVLSRWRLAGTITGAAMMPLVFTMVSHGSHATYEHLHKWFHRRTKKVTEGTAEETSAADSVPLEAPVPQLARPVRHSLHWSVVTLALLAFALSIYSLTSSDSASTTILREKVVETVTVNAYRSTLAVADGSVADSTAVSQDESTTTTVPSSVATVSTVPGDGSTYPGQGTTTTVP